LDPSFSPEKNPSFPKLNIALANGENFNHNRVYVLRASKLENGSQKSQEQQRNLKPVFHVIYVYYVGTVLLVIIQVYLNLRERIIIYLYVICDFITYT